MRSPNVTENIAVELHCGRARAHPAALRNCQEHAISFGVNRITLRRALPVANSMVGSELPAKPRCLLKSTDT